MTPEELETQFSALSSPTHNYSQERERVTSFNRNNIFRRILLILRQAQHKRRITEVTEKIMETSVCSVLSVRSFLSFIFPQQIRQFFIKGWFGGLGIAAGLATAGIFAVSVTGTFNTFSSGAMLKASEMNTNFATLKTAIESIPDWTKSGTSAIFSGGNVIVNTTTAANSANLTVSGRISSANLGLYCGSSTSTNGNIGGYTAAKSLCVTACGNSNAHMCTAHELSLSLQNGISVTATGMWYDGFVLSWDNGSSALLTNCNGWTSNTATPSGTAKNGSNYGWSGACNLSLPIACCL